MKVHKCSADTDPKLVDAYDEPWHIARFTAESPDRFAGTSEGRVALVGEEADVRRAAMCVNYCRNLTDQRLEELLRGGHVG